jgi:hypothetical protein
MTLLSFKPLLHKDMILIVKEDIKEVVLNCTLNFFWYEVKMKDGTKYKVSQKQWKQAKEYEGA